MNDIFIVEYPSISRYAEVASLATGKEKKYMTSIGLNDARNADNMYLVLSGYPQEGLRSQTTTFQIFCISMELVCPFSCQKTHWTK